jgi:hypothetical protein
MTKKKELKFEINGNVLTVADFDWFIDKIDAVYVRHSEIGGKSEYAIFIQQASEIIELYFRTRDEMIIAREYKKLYEAIQAVNPMFDNSVEHFVLINYGNLKEVKYDSSWRGDFVKLQFKNFPLYINGNKKKYGKILEKLDEINGKDFVC